MLEGIVWVPKTEEEIEQVRRQMNRLLETSHFRNSRRYPALFRFLVEETLEGRGEFLKERLLGVRVFNRPPDYDTANDPIVRVTVAEIRKRIAQYYHEEAHESEMRIELLPGHYVPEFHPPRARIASSEESLEAGANGQSRAVSYHPRSLLAPASDSARASERSKPWFLTSYAKATVAAVLFLALCAFWWQRARPSVADEFWGPVLAAHKTVMFCLPMTGRSTVAESAGILTSVSPSSTQQSSDSAAASPVAGDRTILDHETEGENLGFSDVLAMQKISNWLASRKADSRLRITINTTLDDLQQGPTILIGGLDNAWTLREVGRLRYRFLGTEQEQYWIVDTKNPDRRDWEVDLRTQYPAFKRDYALIARVHDEATRQVDVIVAGIGMSGTASAGKFLVDPYQLKELRRRVGPGFRDHDFEAVLGMDVVNGIAGSPRILAVAVW